MIIVLGVLLGRILERHTAVFCLYFYQIDKGWNKQTIHRFELLLHFRKSPDFSENGVVVNVNPISC